MPGARYLVATVAAGCLVAAAPAGAATTIGADVNHAWGYEGSCSGGGDPLQRPCTYINAEIPGREMVAPCDGTVVSFRLNGKPSANTYRLRAVRYNPSDETVTPTATSPTVTIATTGVNTFSTNMSIRKGEYVGLDFMDSSAQGIRGYWENNPAISGFYFYTFPADGISDTATGEETSYYLYNADVECGGPPPAGTKCKKKKRKGKKKSATAAKKKKKKCKKKGKKKK